MITLSKSSVEFILHQIIIILSSELFVISSQDFKNKFRLMI